MKRALQFFGQPITAKQAKAMLTSGNYVVFEEAAKGGYDDTVELFFSQATTDEQIENLLGIGKTSCKAFDRAAEKGHLSTVNIFIVQASQRNQVQAMIEARAYAALHAAIANKHSDIENLLIEALPDHRKTLSGQGEAATVAKRRDSSSSC